MLRIRVGWITGKLHSAAIMPMWDLRWCGQRMCRVISHGKECGQPVHCRRTCSGGEAESGKRCRHITFNLIVSSNGEQAIEWRRYQDPRKQSFVCKLEATIVK